MSQTKVITGVVRFSYLHVFEPQAPQGSTKKKYSVSLIIPKSDKETLAKINKAIENALELGKATFGGTIPKNPKLPLRDGDTDRDDEAYENSYFLSANSEYQPGLVDSNLNPIMSQEEIYSGCWGRASINFYAFNVNGNKGIACGLQNLMKVKDGERLAGGGSTAEEDFGDFVGADDLM